jgi:hypothetical protein
MPNPFEQEEHDEAWTAVKGSISAEDWERECQVGRGESVEDVLSGLRVSELPRGDVSRARVDNG